MVVDQGANWFFLCQRHSDKHESKIPLMQVDWARVYKYL